MRGERAFSSPVDLCFSCLSWFNSESRVDCRRRRSKLQTGRVVPISLFLRDGKPLQRFRPGSSAHLPWLLSGVCRAHLLSLGRRNGIGPARIPADRGDARHDIRALHRGDRAEFSAVLPELLARAFSVLRSHPGSRCRRPGHPASISTLRASPAAGFLVRRAARLVRRSALVFRPRLVLIVSTHRKPGSPVFETRATPL